MEQVPAKLTAIAAKYADGHQYTLDGISVEYPDWHFNVRPSNTEPLLRLNLEATTPELMASRRDEVVSLLRAWRLGSTPGTRGNGDTAGLIYNWPNECGSSSAVERRPP